MPTKPNEQVLNASKKNLNPHDLLTSIIQETPELRQGLLDAGLIEEVDPSQIGADD